MNRPRVLAAMSGGVDSSVAAALLKEQGYEVVGVAMRLGPEMEGKTGRALEASCCSAADFDDARRVAERLGFPFYVVDLRVDFEARVIRNFVSEYLNGRTPNPCVLCNREIKFDRLWQRARALQADYVATGHYARIVRGTHGRLHLLRAHDAAKDQSYFLFSLTQTELARTLFPLGEMTKAEVRAKARALGLVNAEKRESQEICFVNDGNYAAVVERMCDQAQVRPGKIVTPDGTVHGSHLGIHHFTVGQRRGLGVSAREPLYVREIRPATAQVVVAERAMLNARGLVLESLSMVEPSAFRTGTLDAEVKIRYRHAALAATISTLSDCRAEVLFHTLGPAVTPGQACVIYCGEEVLGGGFIQRAL